MGHPRPAPFASPFVLALAFLLALVSGPAEAQFRAPKRVDEIEAQGGKKPRAGKPTSAEEEEPTTTETDPRVEPEDRDVYRPSTAQKPFVPPVEAPVVVDAGPKAVDAGAANRDAGPPDAGPAVVDAGPPILPAHARPLVPVTATLASVNETWEQRRKALATRNPKAQADAEQKLGALRDELHIRDLRVVSSALLAESERKLEARDPVEAVRLARLATTWAPSDPGNHAALAWVLVRADPAGVGAVIEAFQRAVVKTWEEPGPRSAAMANLAASTLIGLALAAFLGLLGMSLRPFRNMVHDVSVLLPRGTQQWQAGGLFVAAVAAPLALGLGPLPALGVLCLALFIHVGMAERVAATLLMALLIALPHLLGLVASRGRFVGSDAEALHLVQGGGPDAAAGIRALHKRLEGGTADLRTDFILALEAKRLGRLDEAAGLLEKALALDPKSAAAINNLGNVKLLQGHLEAARDAYLRATELEPTLALAQYNLFIVSTRRAQLNLGKDVSDDLARAGSASEAYTRLDRTFVERAIDLRANHFVVDAELPVSALGEVGGGDRLEQEVAQQVRLMLFGGREAQTSALATLVLVALGWLLSFTGRWLLPAVSCQRCGRPVSRWTDPEVKAGQTCGQCLYVFQRKGAVDPPTRKRKEGEVVMHQARWSFLRRWGRRLIVGYGQLLSGRSVLGVVFLSIGCVGLAWAVCGPGWLRSAAGSGLEPLRMGLGALVFLGTWALAARLSRGDEAR